MNSSTTNKPTSAPRLEFIDGLRGFAILLVMLRHFYMHAYERGFPRWADVMGLGYLGVHLFLLLSGFCIAWAYLGPRHRPMEIKDFASRRATRILPAYYVALLIAVMMWLSLPPADLTWQIVTHATMTHNLFPDTVLALNGPFWSLALECQLYVAFPLLLIAVRQAGMVAMLLGVLTIQTAFRIWAMRYGTDFNDMTFVVQWSVLGRLLEFGLGMAAASLVAKGETVWQTRGLVLSPICFVLAWVAKGKFGVTHPLTDLLWSAGFWGLLLASSRPQSLLERIFRWRWLAGLGIASYSVYLVHELVMGYVTQFAFAVTGNRLPPVVVMPLAVGLTICACLPFYFLVEKPSITFFANRRKKVHPISQQAVVAAYPEPETANQTARTQG
jgi:peptidoglycan/LPS O-acetylase OafA/YrhL